MTAPNSAMTTKVLKLITKPQVKMENYSVRLASYALLYTALLLCCLPSGGSRKISDGEEEEEGHGASRAYKTIGIVRTRVRRMIAAPS